MLRLKFWHLIVLIILIPYVLCSMGCIWDEPKTDVVSDSHPSWDTDGDNISNAVETNSANSYLGLNPDSANANPSIAHGYPWNGWIGNALNLVNQGTGYYHYNPDKSTIDTDDWGVLHLINMIEGAGRLWYTNSYPPPRIGVGDLSNGDQYTQQFGGYFYPHSSHQNGLDVDIRYVRNDGLEIGLNLADSTQLQYFDEEATKALLMYLIANADIDSIFVDGVHSTLTQMGYSFIVHKSNHSDHFHVRIVDPDGTGN